ncbi:oxaloacetate decarboxylase [Pelagibius sp.]|uniref:isocitrate lyase/PEP mutase family protein n=1 Tax=Pelagibius sp. TaxID=1931238 RepID=UPI0026326670|nr:isocitrate lyase/phosphoenolpyruvate mutase family protein [Pelagibius sp.]
MSPTQIEKFERFQSLHQRPGAFVIPNPWNAGTAKILAALGFEALATTSAGLAFAAGYPDGAPERSRAAVLENAREIVEATPLPVTADLENGYGNVPEDCAETIRLAAAIGLVGGSIEDASGDPDAPIYELSHAVERVAAARGAARDLPFLLTARAENFLHGRRDLDDTIRRLQAFAELGADVVYAPGLPDLAAIRRVCEAVDKPVNVVMGLKGPAITVADLEAAGVKRISVGGGFARTALGALVRAAKEVRDQGTFGFAGEALPHAEANAFMTEGRSPRDG